MTKLEPRARLSTHADLCLFNSTKTECHSDTAVAAVDDVSIDMVSATHLVPKRQSVGLLEQVEPRVEMATFNQREPSFQGDQVNSRSEAELHANIGLRRSQRNRIVPARTVRNWCLLKEKDANDVREHFENLSEEAFRQRFGAARSSSWLVSRLEYFFNGAGFAVGYFKSKRLVAIGEVRPSAFSEKDVCEFGLSVSTLEQGKGLGRDMAIEMRRRAKVRGFQVGEAFVDCSNRRVLALLGHFEGRSIRNGSTLHFLMSL